jgi:glycosyltransferase involved in cell wall biosynthesis
MRVAVFTDNDFDKVNGVTTALRALLAYAPGDIAPRIYTASVLSTDAPDYLALRSPAVPVPFYSGLDIYLPRWREYLRHVIADRIDVLHLTTPGPLGLTAVWIAAKTGLPLVGSFHTDLATYTSQLSGSRMLGLLMARYLRWIYGRCGQTLVPSNATRELLVAAGSDPRRIALWARGVDTELFTPERRSQRLRDRWRASEGNPVLLYVGRISREKHVETFPELLYCLRARGVSHRLVVAGDGPLRRRLADQLPDAVFTGWVDRQDLAEIFASADLFVFPSPTDTAGYVVLEAQASGLPVLVSDKGGPREQMVADVTGCICADARPHAWAAAVADLLSLPRRQQMSAAARHYALGRRWDRALAGLYQVYREVAGARAHPAPVHDAA